MNITVQNLYDKIRPDLRAAIGYPIGEIIAYPFQKTSQYLKLLDKNNILKKSEYPDLYNIIGDYWTEYYKKITSSLQSNRIADETEFMVPNLAGRYLVQRIEDSQFELTDANFQSFKIILNNQLAKIAPLSLETNRFKSNTSNTWTVNTTDRPIININITTQIQDKNLVENDKQINIDDKCVLFYMRIK